MWFQQIYPNVISTNLSKCFKCKTKSLYPPVSQKHNAVEIFRENKVLAEPASMLNGPWLRVKGLIRVFSCHNLTLSLFQWNKEEPFLCQKPITVKTCRVQWALLGSHVTQCNHAILQCHDTLGLVRPFPPPNHYAIVKIAIYGMIT